MDRHAIYTLNVLLLAVAGGQVTVNQLFPDAEEPVDEWRQCTQRWQAAVDGDSWETFIGDVRAKRTWNRVERDLELSLARDGDAHAEPVDPYWIHNFPPGAAERRLSGFRFEDHEMVRLTYHRTNTSTSGTSHSCSTAY